MPTVTFHPTGTSVQVEEGESGLTAAIQAGATGVKCCGITPSCGRCAVVVLEGGEHLTPPDELEQAYRQQHGFMDFQRLACMAYILGPVELEMER